MKVEIPYEVDKERVNAVYQDLVKWSWVIAGFLAAVYFASMSERRPDGSTNQTENASSTSSAAGTSDAAASTP